MSAPAPGDLAPDFTLTGPDGPVSLSDTLAEGPVVLLFYQEANTPLCEAQVQAFAGDHDLVQELGGRVLAVGVDPEPETRRFAEHLAAPFPVLADSDGSVARAYGVWDGASRRANRAAFVIGRDRRVRLAIPFYNPRNSSQFEQVFAALTPDA